MQLAWPTPDDKPASPDANSQIRTVLLQEYSDHGQWARHYSTVRMTLGTFFITAATGLITLRWSTPSLHLALIAGCIFFIGVSLFVIFSKLTFDEMNAQRDIVDSYNGQLKPGTAKLKRLKFTQWKGTGLPFVLVFLIAFTFFDGWWICCSRPNVEQGSAIKVPMKVKLGDQPEVTIEVPVKVSVP